MSKKRFTIWFEQINQSKIDVEAETPKEAYRKARAEWDQECREGCQPYMEDDKGNHVRYADYL